MGSGKLIIILYEERRPLNLSEHFNSLVSLVTGNLWIFVISLSLGIITIGYDLWSSFHESQKTIKSSIAVKELIPLEMGALLSPKKIGGKKALLAEIFNLAENGKLKLNGKVDKAKNLSKEYDFEVSIIEENDLTFIQQKIIEGLKEHKSLKDFLNDEQLCNNIGSLLSTDLNNQEIFSRANIQIRKRLVIFSFLFFFIPAFLMGTYGLIQYNPVLMGITTFLLIVGFGRIIKIPTVPLLSKEGQDLKFRVKEFIKKQRTGFKDRLKLKPDRAGDAFFEKLPYIILDCSNGKLKLKRYTKKVKKIDDLKIPDWLRLDDSDFEIDEDDDKYKKEAVKVIYRVIKDNI